MTSVIGTAMDGDAEPGGDVARPQDEPPDSPPPASPDAATTAATADNDTTTAATAATADNDATTDDGATAVGATGIDATGIDATGIDATGIDATGIDATGIDATAGTRAGGGPRRLVRANRLAALLVAAAVVVAGSGAWFMVEYRAARSPDAVRNTALLDTAATAEVSSAVTTALNRVFSYSFDKPEVTQQAAAEVLRGPALETYNRLFAQVRELAPQQQIVLTTRVVNIAVQSLTGDRAQLLAFLDQSATRATDNTNSTGAAQLSVTAQRDGGRWVIIDLTPR